MFNRIKNSFKKLVEKVTPTEVVKKVTTTKLDEKKLKIELEDLELELIQANVAPEVIDKINQEILTELKNTEANKKQVETKIRNSLEKVIKENVQINEIKITKKPYIILIIGFNGTGKTTTIAKLINYYKKEGKEIVVAAGDTYRAASIEQLETHCNNLGVKLVKHKYGADPAAVGFDAIKHAESSGKDIVIIDTAGRSYENTNLIDELKKINRVIKPDYKILIIDALTGSSVTDQAKKFDEAVGIDGIIITKTDSDTKGGTIISAPYTLNKPLIFLGTGQEYENLEKPTIEGIINKIFSE